MKRSTKLGLGALGLFLGAFVLTGCTNSFCSKEDKAHMLYAFDPGVTQFYGSQEAADAAGGTLSGKLDEYGSVYYSASFDNSNVLTEIIGNASAKTYISTPSLQYFVELDKVVLKHALIQSGINFDNPESVATVTVDMINGQEEHTGVLNDFGYVKFDGAELWGNWTAFDNEVRLNTTLSIDECPTNDFLNFYKSTMNSKIGVYRSCLATKEGYYGNYNGKEIFISGKDYGYAWKTGFFSGLLVYPIGWLIDSFTGGMLKGGVPNGWSQLLSILFVTLIVRSLMLLITFRQTTASSKMQALQPEIAKIQAKYPNSNSNQYEKQRVAEETARLYKKHKINPLTSLLVMVVQFPVFICVWGAFQGSAWLSTGSFLGLDLSDTISSVLFSKAGWNIPAGGGALTALILFILMSAAQTVAMLLPQWMQKAKTKKIAKLGRNPAQKQNDSRGKMFTYIMLIMIIIMGFSLASAMGVYWLVGALFSIAQTLITNAVMNRKTKSKK